MAKEYPLDQVLRAQCALRAAAHMPQERFTEAQFVGMVSDEIEALRGHGTKDAQIAFLIHNASGIEISEAAIRKHYASPAGRGKPRS